MTEKTRNSIFPLIMCFILLSASAHSDTHASLMAQPGNGKNILTEDEVSDTSKRDNPAVKENISENPDVQSPSTADQKTSAPDNKDSAAAVAEPEPVKAEEVFYHPDIILNAYKEAYPELIAEVTRGETDWIVKFANGNRYFWAEGKILPETALKKSALYMSYSIDPYNLGGRHPELYTEEKIKQLRALPRTPEKGKPAVSEEGSLYKELFGISSEESARSQLVGAKLFGRSFQIHTSLREKIESIDAKIQELAKTDPEVRDFLKNIASVQSFNWRKIAWINRMSNHSYGTAIDILPKRSSKKAIYWLWEQDRNKDWMLLPQSGLWSPPDAVIKIFLEEKFIWGGYWDRYDTMHFEYRPELIALFKSIRFNR